MRVGLHACAFKHFANLLKHELRHQSIVCEHLQGSRVVQVVINSCSWVMCGIGDVSSLHTHTSRAIVLQLPCGVLPFQNHQLSAALCTGKVYMNQQASFHSMLQ